MIMSMKQFFRIDRSERVVVAMALAVLLPLHWLMVAKFAPLLMHYDVDTWRTFMRNYHMSGFDPIVYHAVADGSMAFDLLRHPLLAAVLYPLYLLNMGLTAATGVNCVQFVVAALLMACGLGSVLMVYRTCLITGTPRGAALLLSALFLSFAYVMLSLIVADHFALSMLLLTLYIYIAALKLHSGTRFSPCEAAVAVVLMGGITLSNAALACIIVAAVNGRSLLRPRMLLGGIVVPGLLLATVALLLTLTWGDAASAVNSQVEFIGSDASRMAIFVENFLGESLQLHRGHVLGDVLTGRPVVVPYNHWVQYLVVAATVSYALFGFIAGRRSRMAQMLAALLAFNIVLHLVIGFALEEVYIMAAHWVPVIPLSTAFLLKRGGTARHTDRQPATKLMLTSTHYLIITAVALWLYCWHGYILYNYLTWPLRP